MEKFEVDLEVIKCKIHDENLSEDFINDLEEKLNNEYNKSSNVDNNINTDIKKNNVVKFPFHFCKTAVAVFACFLIFSTYTFADEIEDIIKAMFCSVSPTSETAYDDGKLIEVDSEYQKFGEISAKVDYVSVHENDICIAINVKSDSEYDNIYLGNLKITADEEVILDEIENKNTDIEYVSHMSRKTTNNCELIINISKSNSIYNEIKSLNIYFNEIKFEKNNKINTYLGEWKFKLNINKEG